MLKVAVSDNFARSVELEFDFFSGKRVQSYLVTSKGRELLNRVVVETSEKGGGAFSIIGTYGSGKSAFALFAASLFSGDTPTYNRLVNADSDLAHAFESEFKLPLLPVLVTGRRESIAKSIVRGLISAVSIVTSTSGKSEQLIEIESKIKAFESSSLFLDHGKVLKLVNEVETLAYASGFGGLFLVVDELGKLLEHAALHPKESDVFLLQTLAEKSVRSKDANSKFVFLTILHQAVERYATRLATTQQEEWRKVQGRFEDFSFVESIDETVRLLGNAIDADFEQEEVFQFAGLTARVIQNATLPNHFERDQLQSSLIAAAPLSPVVSLLVGPTFRRLAQNERSLFAFLVSKEIGGFISVTNGQAALGMPLQYRISDFLDYLLATIGPTLLHGRDSLYWSETETVLHRCDSAEEIQINLIKAIAVLGYVGYQVGLKSDLKTLAIALDLKDEEADRHIASLIEQKLISYRPIQEEFVIWQGSDFDLDEWLKTARANVSNQVSVAQLLADATSLAPIVARRHSYETGVHRYFEPKFVSAANWFVEAGKLSDWSDGKIVYVCCSSDEERDLVLHSLADGKVDISPLNIVSILPDVSYIRDAAYDVLCFDWINANCLDLAGDPSARRELSQRRIDTSAYLEGELSTLLFRSSTNEPVHWAIETKLVPVRSSREQQERLSNLCDDVFFDSPKIWNELINRRKPSASAVSATKHLLRAMIEFSTEPGLSISGTPAEFGLYSSILNKGGLHLDGAFQQLSRSSEDTLNIRPLFQAFETHLMSQEGAPVNMGSLLQLAQDAPFGLRRGLFLVLLFSFILARKNEIALYEDSALLIDIGQYEIDRLIKDPSRFAVQMVKIQDDRKALLNTYADVVGLDESEVSVLGIVSGLLKKARQLTPYARRTGNLESRDTAVREALFKAEDPIRLLFEDMPLACGGSSQLVETDPTWYPAFGLFLESSLRSITNAYSALLLDLQDELARALMLHSSSPEERRSEITMRSRPLLKHATNEKFRAFLVRATDAVMDTGSWFESLAALLAELPPKHWIDKTREVYRDNLREVARYYVTLEPLVFDELEDASETADSRFAGDRLRLSVTALGQDEKARVINVHAEDQDLVSEAVSKLKKVINSDLLDRNIEFKLAVMAHMFSDILDELAVEKERMNDEK